MYKIRVFDRVFCPDPHRPFGDFENPLRAPGIWTKITSQKPDFSILIFGDNLYIHLLNFICTHHFGITVVYVHSVFFLGYDGTNLMIYSRKLFYVVYMV